VQQPVRFGIRIPPCHRVDRIAETAARADRLGFDAVWLPDSQLLWRDVFASLAVVAMRTERVHLGTAVTNLATRHPAVVASAARTIAELAPGRFRLGIGVGDSSVEPVGLVKTTQAELRAGLKVIRTLLAGQEVDFGTARSRLRDPGPSFPTYLAASGPRNLSLAGELADGVILLSGVSPATLASSLEQVRVGAEAAGRRLQDLDVVVSTYAHVTDDVERDARLLKPICATIAHNGGIPFLAAAGVHVDTPVRVDAVYPDLIHAEDWDLAVERSSAWVSDEAAVRFAEGFCLFGDAGQIRDRLAAAAAAGAASFLVQHVGSYTLPTELMEAFADVAISARAPS
jgi:5,10-methylenetetrahydromethanopterin reductase